MSSSLIYIKPIFYREVVLGFKFRKLYNSPTIVSYYLINSYFNSYVELFPTSSSDVLCLPDPCAVVIIVNWPIQTIVLRRLMG